MIGSTLSHFRILRKIGEGGMGVVYEAQDLSLDRRVALKVLPAEVAGDPERRARFAREAKAVAALNHPNIVVIHSVDEAGGIHFLTMELVPGKTLAHFIPKEGLPLERFFQIAIPVADAIRAAHQRGITHRDLKPANIIISDEDGRPKVLDFGLAKLKEEIRATVGASTISSGQVTADGRILGTVAYMSPEQAEGKAVDHRSDIFSLGVILYEMATGARPFRGDSNMSVLSSIIKDTPKPITELNPHLPRELARVVRRCLEKDPERRFDSAKDLRNDLEDIKRELDSGELRVAARAATGTRGRGRRPWLLAAAGAALIILATAAFWWWIGRGSPAGQAPPAVNFVELTSLRGVEAFPSLSPDGKWLAYTGDAAGNWDIYLQSVSGQNPINLTKDSPAADYQPAFSPDGQSIAFGSDREGGGIFVMGLTGENVRRISDVGFNPAWSPDGREIACATVAATVSNYDRQGISEVWVVEVGTGEKRRVVTVDAMQPHWSPHGKRIAFWGVPPGSSRADIWTVAAAGGAPVPVTSDEPRDWSPAWSPDGGWLYFATDRGGALNLWRVAIDEDTGAVRGAPQTVPAPSKWIGHLTFSLDGSKLAFCSFTGIRNIQRFGLDPESVAIRDSGQWVTSRSQFASSPFLHLSPDGKSLVYNDRIEPVDPEWIRSAELRQSRLTKPPRSLGRLEEIANRCAAILRILPPHLRKSRLVIFAGDHGVCAENVTPYPQAVTAQMVRNFLRGGAAINAIARSCGIELQVVDVGVAGEAIDDAALMRCRIAAGTRNLAREPAMTRAQAMAAIDVGVELAQTAVSEQCDLLGIGEMGIGNTTSASALAAVLSGSPAASVTGRGTGLDDAQLSRKIDVVDRAVQLHGPHCADPIDLLARLGGLEIAAMCGFCLGAAVCRRPVVIDGFIATAAATVATRLAPAAGDYFVAGHRSTEPGHTILLEILGQRPLLDLEMRLGEGTGAALGMAVTRAAAAALAEMATFEAAGVSGAKQAAHE